MKWFDLSDDNANEMKLLMDILQDIQPILEVENEFTWRKANNVFLVKK